ncbi:hypothetical protein Tco_0434412 [Tanacetum coccineum]
MKGGSLQSRAILTASTRLKRIDGTRVGKHITAIWQRSRSQSIQTIHMLAPKCPTYNGRPTFANPRYLKKAQNEIPCLYAIPHHQSDPANRLVPDREETQTLDAESRSKLNKDLVTPF